MPFSVGATAWLVELFAFVVEESVRNDVSVKLLSKHFRLDSNLLFIYNSISYTLFKYNTLLHNVEICHIT